jgi:hypothetical protein
MREEWDMRSILRCAEGEYRWGSYDMQNGRSTTPRFHHLGRLDPAFPTAPVVVFDIEYDLVKELVGGKK